MTMLEKQRQEEAAPQRMVFPPPKLRNAWVTFGVALVVGAALAIAIALIVTSGSSDEPAPAAEVGPAVTLYTAEENALQAAVAGGFVPAQALETELLKTKQLVNQGYLPSEALRSQFEIRPLYTEAERAFLRAAANGVVPPAALETDLFKTKALVNQGLVPPEALQPLGPGPVSSTDPTAMQRELGDTGSAGPILVSSADPTALQREIRDLR